VTRFMLTTAMAAMLASGAWAESHGAAMDQPGQTASADLINTDDESIGTATLTDGPAGMLIHVRVEGLTPGKHGLHLHAVGTCESSEGFTTATGHVGKVEGGHGLLNPEGPEPGDLPNIFVGEDGIGEMEAYSTLVDVASLLDEDGSTFIIHAQGDDHMSQPIGGAGDRVACGLIKGQ